MYEQYTCKYCKARLDPTEKCECLKEKREEQEKIVSLLALDTDGQYVLKEAVS